jgi:hypothetical protein
VPKWKVSGKDQSKNKKVNSWRNWHMSFLFSKKRIFWGRVNFVIIGPKWKVFEKESR